MEASWFGVQELASIELTPQAGCSSWGFRQWESITQLFPRVFVGCLLHGLIWLSQTMGGYLATKILDPEVRLPPANTC